MRKSRLKRPSVCPVVQQVKGKASDADPGPCHSHEVAFSTKLMFSVSLIIILYVSPFGLSTEPSRNITVTKARDPSSKEDTEKLRHSVLL